MLPISDHIDSSYCNGGTVEQVLEKYCDRGIPVPEHFVWHVAQRLAESLRFLHFGAVPNNGADQPGWQCKFRQANFIFFYCLFYVGGHADLCVGAIVISHRDFAPNNIFIHYQPRRPGAVRKVGLEGNAFPDVVVGDFGCAGQDGDDKLSPGIYDTDSIKECEDIYWLGNILRRLCQTHIPAPNVLDVVGKPECYPMSGVDGLMGAGHTPYSDDLIQILQNFEWPGCVADGDPTGLRPGADGLQHENWEWQPTAAWVRDTLLPLARRKANEYRNPPPAAFVPDYYTRLDVSWTKPEELMPFEYDFRYSVAGDEVDGEVEEEGEDEEMPEQPEEPEEPEEPGESLGLEDPQEPQEAQEPQDVQDLEVSVEELEINTSENEDLEDDEVPESESEEHECPVPESEMRMRSLQGFRVHHRDHGQPRFRVMALQFNVPTIVTPVNRGPPSLILEGGGGGGDDDDDVEMGDAS